MSRKTLAIAILAAAGVGVFAWGWQTGGKFSSPPKIAKPEERSEPRTPEEEIVKKYVLDRANDPASVKFATWGPHAGPGEYRKIGNMLGVIANNEPAGMQGYPGHVIRAVYRERNTVGALIRFDRIFYFDGDGGVAAEDNPFGDGWLTYWTELEKLGKSLKTAN